MNDHKVLRSFVTERAFFKHILVFDELPSTNSYALERVAELDSGTVIITHRQPHGRGRMDRAWFMHEGDSACSLVIKAPDLPSPVSLLSLMVPMAIVDGLKTLGIETYIKWPNDIIYKNTRNEHVSYFANYLKLAGILIENTLHENRVQASVIGIGLNIVKAQDQPHVAHRGYIHELDERLMRDEVQEALLSALATHFVAYREPGYVSDLFKRYQEKCLSLGRDVMIEQQGEILYGQCCGMSADGGLIVRVNGDTLTLYGGEVNFCT